MASPARVDKMITLEDRPGRGPERLAANGSLLGDPILVGYRLPIRELFGWLTLRRPKSPPPSRPGPPVPGESTR